MISVLAILVFSYLIGSIPTSLIVSSLLKGIDIRDYGSGNAGGTNTFRVLGWKPGLFVIIVDMLKGVVVALFLVGFFEYNKIGEVHTVNKVLLQLMAGTAAIIGHVYTVFANFRGGKGISTAAGLMFAIAPITMLLAIAIFFLTVVISRYVSLSSLVAVVSFPIVIAVRKYVLGLGDGIDYYANILGVVHVIHDSLDYKVIIFGILFSALFIYTHRSNIHRLICGTENRIRFFLKHK